VYCGGLLRPGVITALLGVGVRSAQSRQPALPRDPVSATRFWLQQLIRKERPRAGSTTLNLSIPAPCYETDNPTTWALLIGSILESRLEQLPAAAQPAPLLPELTAWLSLVTELHSVFGDNLLQEFTTNTILRRALMLYITTPALQLELRQHAGGAHQPADERSQCRLVL